MPSVVYGGVGLVLASAEAVGEVCVVSAIGFALALYGVLAPPAVSTLAKLTFNVFLPCLLYTSIAMAISGTAALQSMWSVAALCVLQVAALFAVAAVGNAVLGIPSTSRPLTTMMVAFNNSGYVPLVLIPAVLRRVPAMLGDDREGGMDRVNAYIAVWMSTLSVQLWVVGFSYFARETKRFAALGASNAEAADGDRDGEEDIEMSPLILSGDADRLLVPAADKDSAAAAGVPRGGRASVDGVAPSQSVSVSVMSAGARGAARASLECAYPERASLERDHAHTHRMSSSAFTRGSPAAWLEARWMQVRASVRENHALNPPMAASLAAVATVVTPGVRGILIGDESALGFITDAMRVIGQAATPLSMVVLGAELAFSHIRSRPGYTGYLENNGHQGGGAAGPSGGAQAKGSNLPAHVVVGVSIQRLVISPLLAVGLMAAFAALLPGSLCAEPLCRFVILVEGATPSAMNLVLICIMAGVDPGPCARTLFYQYLTSILTLTVWISLFLRALWT